MADESVTSLVTQSKETGIVKPGELPAIDRFREVQELLRKSAEERRRKKTPKSLRKPRVIGKDDSGNDKTVDTVDRPAYQRWLDDTFPGWSIPTCNYSTLISTDGKPLLFNCDLMLEVVDNGIKRSLPGTGSAAVSEKELSKGNTSLFIFKRTIAQTNAIKNACGWLGAFFDLRVDEEARERASMSPTDAAKTEYADLIKEIPDGYRDGINAKWAQQNVDSAPDFLKKLREKIEERKKTVQEVVTATQTTNP